MDNSSFAIVPFVQDNLLVFIALALCAALALLVIVGMVWGARLKRQRVHAESEEEARIDAMEADGHTPEPTSAQKAAGVGPATVGTAGEDAASEPASPPAITPQPGSPPRSEPSTDEDAMAAPDPLDDEPIAAAAPLDASPATEAEPTGVPSAGNAGDEPVTRLKGLGPKVAARLAELGITTVGQVAALDDAQADTLDAELGAFRGRMARDQWREQARLLAAGDRAGYEATYGKLG